MGAVKAEWERWKSISFEDWEFSQAQISNLKNAFYSGASSILNVFIKTSGFQSGELLEMMEDLLDFVNETNIDLDTGLDTVVKHLLNEIEELKENKEEK